MTTLTSENAMTLGEIAQQEAGVSGASEWVRALRESGARSFAATGIPTTRDESWRFTNLKALDETRFIEAPDEPDQVDSSELVSSSISMELSARLVFVNGRFAPGLSQLENLPEGVVIKPLRLAIEEDRELVEPHLGRLATFEGHPFTALNTALMGDGVFIHVAKGVRVEHPIGVRHLAVGLDAPTLKNPRSLVVAEEGSRVCLAERFASKTDEDVYFTNAVTEVFVGKGARVSHYFIQRESTKAYNVFTRFARLDEKSHFESHTVMLGGAITRNEVVPTFEGEDAEAVLNGVYIVGEGQHVDNTMRVLHNAPNCRSRQFYKGLLDGDGRGVFTGRIVVDQIAQQTDAVQSNRNLLLSDRAQALTRPQLEIYADDVRCTHGATVGELDDEAMFYLRARGLTEQVARALLVVAFARENIDRMDLAPVRDWLRAKVISRLPDTDLLAAE